MNTYEHDRKNGRAVTGRGVTRRQFLAKATAAAAGLSIVPASSLGKDGHTAANDRIVVGAIGCGVRGSSAISLALRASECQVVAVCDVRRPRLVRAQERCNGHYGRAGQKGSYKGCEAYHEYRELLARDDIDAVLLTPSDHWHGVIYSDAIRAGKDMYAEKPITRTIAEGKALRKLVKQYGTIFQTGTHSRSHAWVRHACELVRNGYLGRIHTIEVSAPSGREYPTIASCDPPEGFDYDRWTFSTASELGKSRSRRSSRATVPPRSATWPTSPCGSTESSVGTGKPKPSTTTRPTP